MMRKENLVNCLSERYTRPTRRKNLCMGGHVPCFSQTSTKSVGRRRPEHAGGESCILPVPWWTSDALGDAYPLLEELEDVQ